MVTYEDITEMFLDAAEQTGLSIHPEHWLNPQTLEREFACTIHPGPCEDAEGRAACMVSFAWAPLDTVLSFDGAEGVCEFFHEPDEDCPHLHTDDVPPLVLELSYNLPLERVRLNEIDLQMLTRALKLRASEHSSRATETRSTISLALGDGGMEAEALVLAQRVELPLWDPEGPSGLRSTYGRREGHVLGRRRTPGQAQPHPEDWLPHLFAEVAEDVEHVIEALEAARVQGHMGNTGHMGAHDGGSNN